MATFLLIRHGNTDMVGRVLAGRMPGVHLNEEGRTEAEELAQRLAPYNIDFLCSSPLERTRETARPIAELKGLEVEIREGLTEIDTGEWTGMQITDLQPRKMWKLFNSFRTGTRIPGGEHILEVQKRMVDEIENLRSRAPSGSFGIFSHGDPIKTVIAYYAGMQLDSFDRITISPASLSILVVEDHGSRIKCLNNTANLPL
jgi:probable phosphomutase (TIGR03848 family)